MRIPLKLLILRNRLRGKFKRRQVYTGVVKKMNPMHDLKKGQLVIAPAGMATVADTRPVYPFSFGPAHPSRWVRINLLRKNFPREHQLHNLYRYYIYNEELDLYWPLVDNDYNRIIQAGEVVEFHTTKRGFAELSKRQRKRRDLVAIINSKDYSRSIVVELNQKGFPLEKYGRKKQLFKNPIGFVLYGRFYG